MLLRERQSTTTGWDGGAGGGTPAPAKGSTKVAIGYCDCGNVSPAYPPKGVHTMRRHSCSPSESLLDTCCCRSVGRSIGMSILGCRCLQNTRAHSVDRLYQRIILFFVVVLVLLLSSCRDYRTVLSFFVNNKQTPDATPAVDGLCTTASSSPARFREALFSALLTVGDNRFEIST